MQQGVANHGTRHATLSVMKSGDYWREVCAPKLRGRKREIGREMTNTEIAAAVEARSGKSTTRQLVEHFFNGRREPYISQFFALCEVMRVEPIGVLTRSSISTQALHARRQPAVRVQENVRMRKALRHSVK